MMVGRYAAAFIGIIGLLCVFSIPTLAQTTQQGSVGLEGRISAPPPTQAATISFPRDGTSSSNGSTQVSGLCQSGLIVKIFKNNVFAGAVPCVNGSFSLQIDLFNGRNELIAKLYDDLDQAGPDSNTVVVTVPMDAIAITDRVLLTSAFAKRGANPGQKLVWPINISGGSRPYAITVDWGDGKTADVISQPFVGNMNIEHIYENPGTYTVIIRASDTKGQTAFLQLIGIANGSGANIATGSTGQPGNGANNNQTQVKILWMPALVSIPLILLAFWLGRKHQLSVLRKRLQKPEN